MEWASAAGWLVRAVRHEALRSSPSGPGQAEDSDSSDDDAAADDTIDESV